MHYAEVTLASCQLKSAVTRLCYQKIVLGRKKETIKADVSGPLSESTGDWKIPLQ